MPENLIETAKATDNIKLTYNLREGYDHGYYFVASFIGKHLAHHSFFLK